ncbi:MAG: outer membrane beta-barrel protein [Flavobacteriales bacterium]|nr:outer membrane beta-barrel protein [Flavobacteriales bacterium]
MDIVKLRLVVLILFVLLGQKHMMAQSYLHSRVGLGWGRYGPYDEEKLDVNEHNIKLGVIVDLEYGREFVLKNEKFALLLGGRFGYNLRVIEGTFRENEWDPDADIDAHMFSAFLTPGASMKFNDRFSMFLQANVGPTFILWYQDGDFRDSFWVFYLPVDLGVEYQLKEDLNLTFGINVQMPIYTGTQETLMLGIRKEF